jgi:hypothetical protein
LLAYQDPKDFRDNAKVILDNSWLKVANSKNYHHFFPKKYLKGKTVLDSNSLMNITLVSSHLNKRKIGARAPSVYIGEFADQNSEINTALNSHFIGLKGYGIESNDYQQFLTARAGKIFAHLKSRIDLTRIEPEDDEIEQLVIGGETESVEFKSTLRYDMRTKAVNKKLEYVIAKTISAFLNSKGGDLFIGIDDDQNVLGLKNDISTLKKQNIDGFELQLIEVIKKYIGKEFSSHIKIELPEYKKQKICRISVSPSSKPVFVSFEGKEDFFVRYGCSSQPLSREEQSAYEKNHWG